MPSSLLLPTVSLSGFEPLARVLAKRLGYDPNGDDVQLVEAALSRAVNEYVGTMLLNLREWASTDVEPPNESVCLFLEHLALTVKAAKERGPSA